MCSQLRPLVLLFGLLLQAESAPCLGQETLPSQDAVGRQPGDDVTETVEPAEQIDPKQTEALAWYMKGIEAQRNNDPQAALEAFQKASEADETAPDPIRARAMLLLQMGEVTEGLKQARRAISLDEGDFRTRFQVATILLRQRSVRAIQEAIELLNEAAGSDRLTRSDPEFILIHSVRGRILLQLNQHALAAESYEILLQALERPEDFGLDFRRHKALMDDQMTGYETVGEAMLAVGRTAEAVRAFEALVRIRQDSPGRHHLLLARARFRADDIEKSEASLERYFATTRARDRDALELLTRIYSATSRSSMLISKLKELESDSPDSTVVTLFLAETQLKQGRLDEATETFERVITETGDPAGYLGLIRIDIVRADADALIRTLQKALRARVELAEIFPFLPEIVTDQEFASAVVESCLNSLDSDTSLFPEVTWICAQIAQEIQASEAQGTLLQATLDRNPGQEIGQRALQQLGMHHLLNNRADDAARLFRRLLTLRTLSDEMRALTLRNLALAEADAGRIEPALEAIRTALAMLPQNPELLYRLGWIHFLDDNMSDAQEALKDAIQKGANAPDVQNNARMLLAAIYSRAQEWEDCIREYDAVIGSDTQNPDLKRRARLSLSAVYVEKGDNASAEQILEELYDERPEDPGVNNDLGYLYADQNKKLEQALKMIEFAVSVEPENRAYLDSLGWVLYRLGRYEEALEALLKANSDPDFQDATLQEHLGDVYEALGRHDEALEQWKKAAATEQASEIPDQTVLERLRSRLSPADIPPESSSSPQSAPESPE